MTYLTPSPSAASTTRLTSSAAIAESPIWMPLLVASNALLDRVQLTPAASKIRTRLSMYSGKLMTSMDESRAR